MKRLILGLALVPALSVAETYKDEAVPPALQERVAKAEAAVAAGGQGPFKAAMISDPNLPTHTLYAPRDIKATKRGKLPIIAWGNGACRNVGNRFSYFLTEIASHGYLIIAIGPVGPKIVEWHLNPEAENPLPPAERLPNSYAAQLNDAIDWAIAENSRRGSPYFGKLDTKSIGVAGQSCGGLQAIAASADKRVTTSMIWNSGTFAPGTRPLAGTGDATKASLKRLHAPTAWITGDESDTAWKNSNADFEAVTDIPAFRAWAKGTGHSEVYREPMGGVYAPVAVGWFDWQLKGSKTGRAMFMGPDCGLCKNPQWVVKQDKLR